MKKALIIGAAGFVGKHLTKHIHDEYDWYIHVTKMQDEELDLSYVKIHDVDILEYEEIMCVLNEIKPDYIFHLAAQSSVALSWKNPQLTVDVNIKGSLNVLEAVRKLRYKPRILLVGSGEEYGRINMNECPIKEETVLRPGNIYAASKACQSMLGKIYADAYDLDIMNVRAFNHIGPGQNETFVVSDFCKQVAEIELAKRDPVISVGDLSAQRDFSDVRDIVRAYGRLVTRGKTGETYNVGSGQAISIQEILNIIISKSVKHDIEVRIDERKLRPIEVPIIRADLNKLEMDIGWKPQLDLDKTIEDTLEYWRQKIVEEIN